MRNGEDHENRKAENSWRGGDSVLTAWPSASGSSDRWSYLARITLSIYTGSGEIIETDPVDVLIQNFDRGELLPISEIGESKLREFLDSGTTAPKIITPGVIQTYFQVGGSSGAFGARLPALPDWYRS